MSRTKKKNTPPPYVVIDQLAQAYIDIDLMIDSLMRVLKEFARLMERLAALHPTPTRQQLAATCNGVYFQTTSMLDELNRFYGVMLDKLGDDFETPGNHSI